MEERRILPIDGEESNHEKPSHCVPSVAKNTSGSKNVAEVCFPEGDCLGYLASLKQRKVHKVFPIYLIGSGGDLYECFIPQRHIL